MKAREILSEAITKLPLVDKDFEALDEILARPIPACLGLAVVEQVIVDDELSDEIAILADRDPDRDIRPLIIEWFDRVMPDQKYRGRTFSNINGSESVFTKVNPGL